MRCGRVAALTNCCFEINNDVKTEGFFFSCQLDAAGACGSQTHRKQLVFIMCGTQTHYNPTPQPQVFLKLTLEMVRKGAKLWLMHADTCVPA